MSIDIKWFPPSWFQIKSRGKVIYIDPAYLKTHFLKYPTNVVFSDWPDEIDGLPEPLEKSDLVLISHHHKDHCKKVTIDRIKDNDTVVLLPERCLKSLGLEFTQTRQVKPGDIVTVEQLNIRVIDAYNTPEGSSTKKVHHKGDGVGYLLSIEGKTIYHAGDTDLIPEMADLGHVDVALLPVGGTYTMDVPEAIKAALLIKPGVVIPMHYKDVDLKEFKENIESGSTTKVVCLGTGESYRLD